jgi:hypothetical protein
VKGHSGVQITGQQGCIKSQYICWTGDLRYTGFWVTGNIKGIFNHYSVYLELEQADLGMISYLESKNDKENCVPSLLDPGGW